MTKKEYLTVLRKCLSKLPDSELEEQLSYYSEMIDDYMEEGLSEEEAVSKIGNIEEIIQDSPQPKKTKKLKVWEIVLLAIGSPVWASLLIAAAAVVFSLYAALWSVLIALWACFISCAVCVPAGIILAVVQIASGDIAQGIALIGATLVCAGLTVLLFMGCKAATKATVKTTKNLFQWLKNRFSKKEAES